MTSAGIEPDPAEPFVQPTPATVAPAPRRATSGQAKSKTLPGPAKPRRAKADQAGLRGGVSAPALSQLAAEVGGDSAVVWQFVSDYLDLLDHRMAAVEAAITAGNAERAEVALLSLESTSLMVGADAIVRAVRPIRIAIAQTDFAAARTKLPGLRRAKAADRTRLLRARDEHHSAD